MKYVNKFLDWYLINEEGEGTIGMANGFRLWLLVMVPLLIAGYAIWG
jgi:hypothetical protein